MSATSKEMGKCLALLVIGTLLVDWSLRTLAVLALDVLPIVLLLGLPVIVAWGIWQLLERHRNDW